MFPKQWMRLTGAAAAMCASAVLAQTYPAKPIRFIVPNPPGGGTDVIARLVSQKYADALKQPVIVDNRPGAATNIAADIVAKAAPDGYTWHINSTAQAIAAALYRNLSYDPEKDLAPVATLLSSTLVFVAPAKLPVTSLKELIALARAQPGKLNFGSTGIGSGNHIVMEMFKLRAGIDAVHVPYKGDAGLFPALFANDVQFALAPSQTATLHLKNGRVRALAVATPARAAALPDVPTMAEASGFPDFEYRGWTGLFTTAGTPREVLRRISDETARITAMPEIVRDIRNGGAEPYYLGPDDFTTRYRADIAKFRKVVAEANIKVE